MQSLLTLSAVTVSGSGMLLLEGCPVSQSQLAQLVAEVGTGLSGVLPYIKSVSAMVATQIQSTFSALETAVQAWKPGTVIADVEQAVNAFVANMALIPVLGAYQPLVALIVATAEGIITLLIPNPAPQTSAVRAMATRAASQYPHPPRTAGQFKRKYNSVAKANNLPVSID
jgi:hypothetical protein